MTEDYIYDDSSLISLFITFTFLKYLINDFQVKRIKDLNKNKKIASKEILL